MTTSVLLGSGLTCSRIMGRSEDGWSMIAMRSLDMPCGKGSVSGMLMTLSCSILTEDVGGDRARVETTSSDTIMGSSFTLTSFLTSMSMGSIGGGGGVTTSTIFCGGVATRGGGGVGAGDFFISGGGGAMTGVGLVLSEKMSSLSKSTEQALVWNLEDCLCLKRT